MFLFHGIDDDGGYSSIPSPELGSHLEYMNSNITDYWIATFDHVVKYIKERNAVSLTEFVISPDSLQLTVSDNLDDTIYDVPVSIRRILPSNWKDARVYDNKELIPSEIIMVEAERYLVFDAIPDRGQIYLSKYGKTINMVRNSGDKGPIGPIPCSLPGDL